MSDQPPRQVLGGALKRALGGRRVRAAVFTTFTFDPEFFELYVLTLLFDRAWVRDANVRRAQLEECLREVEQVAVYYDRNAYQGGVAGLDYERHAIDRPGHCFHAKHIVLLVEDSQGRPAAVCVTGSANLTRSGCWENVEGAFVDELGPGTRHAGEISALLARIAAEDRTGARHDAIGALRAFLDADTAPEAAIPGEQGIAYWDGREPFATFLGRFAAPGMNLEIIAPYVEVDEAAPILRALIAAVRPAETRLHLPIDRDGRVMVSEGYVRSVAAAGVSWGDLPGDVTRWTKDTGGGHRFVHAKVYRLFDERREVIVAGSVNLTDAAHAPRNFESVVAVRHEARSRRDFWMARRLALPAEFAPPVVSEDQPKARTPPLTLSFDWTAGVLRAFWEGATRPGLAIAVAAAGPLFGIHEPARGQWIVLPGETTEAMRARLRASASVQISVDGGPWATIMVREEGLRDRPSLLERLTPEQILEYWSLLAPEQRDDFLSRHAHLLSDLPDAEARRLPALPGRDDGPTFFDRFAGIFHAFGCLAEHLEQALTGGRQREAEYRLLGGKHDSLGSLIDRVLADASADPVNRYIQLLCAREVLAGVQARHADWLAGHSEAVAALRRKLIRLAEARADLAVGGEDPAAFLEWFEAEFSC